MKSDISTKEYLSPFLAVTFIVVAVTGLLLFFGIHARWIGVVHEWVSVLLVCAGIIHLILNWRLLKNYLSGRSARVAILAGIIITLIFGVLSQFGHEERHGRGPEREQASDRGQGDVL